MARPAVLTRTPRPTTGGALHESTMYKWVQNSLDPNLQPRQTPDSRRRVLRVVSSRAFGLHRFLGAMVLWAVVLAQADSAAARSGRVLSQHASQCSPGQINATNSSAPAGWQCVTCMDGFSCPQNGTMAPCLSPNQYASHGTASTWGDCANVSIGNYVVRAFVNGSDIGIASK